MVRLPGSAQGLQNPVYKVVGKNIEKFRGIRGLSLDELALITGYNRASIRNMVLGKHRLHLDTVDLFAQSLDFPMYAFFTDSNAEARYWKGEYILIEQKFQKLEMKADELKHLVDELTKK